MPIVIPVHGGEDIVRNQLAKENKATFGYQILDAPNDGGVVALATLEAWIPSSTTVNGHVLKFDAIRLRHVECEVYEADVDYVHPDKQENEEDQSDAPQLSFDASKGTQHVTHSLRTLRAYGAAPDKHKQAIGVERTAKGEIKIKGTDAPCAELKLRVSAKIARPADPFAFGRTLGRNAGKCNRSTWRGFTKWELMLIGAKVSGKLKEKWTLDYEFDCSETITAGHNFFIGQWGPIHKEGHAYLWVEWQQVVKPGAAGGYVPGVGIVPAKDTLAVEPVAVFIEQLAWDFDLTEIGL